MRPSSDNHFPPDLQPSSKSEDEPYLSVFLPDRGVPPILVVGKRHTSDKGIVIIPKPSADDLLHKHAHTLVEIEEIVILPVHDRCWAVGADMDLLEGLDEIFEPRLNIPLIREEHRLILS